MRSFWSQLPMLRITLAVIAGIGAEIFADAVLHIAKDVAVPVAGLLMITFVWLVTRGMAKTRQPVQQSGFGQGIAVTILLLCFGYLLAWLHAGKNYPSHFKNHISNQSFIEAEITEPPLYKTKVMSLVAEVLTVKNGNNTFLTTGKILISQLRDSTDVVLHYGDRIVFRSHIEEFNEPLNPDEFNFKLYQSFHNIYHRTFIAHGQWKLTATGNGNKLIEQTYQLRDYFLSLIKKYVSDKNNLAVAAAITLGYNDYMNGEVTQAYASSGALHVLSVSGLHVGIMFLMLNFLLKWMDKRGRKMQIAKAFIVIIFIWFYAILTGLSPSVLRSAMMFSMIQLGTTLLRNVNTYNIIFGSALLLMLVNPFIITEVGFRLSYLAVIGIIYLYPKFYSLAVFKNRLLDQAWMIIAVSLAAQIATFPLSLYYFHQFPVLFLLSNLVVIPVSNLVLFVGTGLFATGAIPYLGNAFGWCFNALLSGLNKFIFFVDSLPVALIKGISISMIEMVAIYILLLLLCWLTEERRAKVLLAALLVVFGLTTYHAIESIQKTTQQKIVVYAVAKQRAIAFINGRNVHTYFDETLLNNGSSMLFHVQHHWWNCGVKQQTPLNYHVLPFGKLLQCANKKILIIDSALEKPKFEMPQKLNVDIVVLTGNPKIYIDRVQSLVRFNEIIFDSSNKKWRINYWKKDCEKLKIKYWDVNASGAYVNDLKEII